MAIKARGSITLVRLDDGEDAAIRSDTAPSDTSKLWFDITSETLKYYDDSQNEWIPVNENEMISNNNSLTQSITESYTSAINEMKDQIELNVSQIIEKITGNENGEVAENVNSLSTSLSITAGQLELVNTLVNEISDKITGLTTKEELKNWVIVDSSGVLHLGTNRDKFEAQLSNTTLAFYDSGTKVAWISNNELHQLKAVIEESLTIGRWALIDDDTYGFVLKWVGDS